MNEPTDEHIEVQNKRVSPPVRNAATRTFWGAIVVMAVATITVALIGSLRSGDPDSTVALEFDPTTIEEILHNASEATLAQVMQRRDALLDGVYEPVYAAIPDYADFHYSLVGEYSLLFMAVQGGIGDDLQERLFEGFQQRIDGALDELDSMSVELYKSNLDAVVRDALNADGSDAVLGEATQLALDDAMARARLSIPIAGAASVVGSGGLKALTAGMATKLATTIGAKATAKGAAKGGAALAGAGGGTALCAWAGPFAAICGAAGGIAAWLLADGAIVNIAQLLNQDEFEANLESLVDEHKSEMNRRIGQALRERFLLLDEAAEPFRLRDLPGE